MMIEPDTSTKPEAGVIATRPATARAAPVDPRDGEPRETGHRRGGIGHDERARREAAGHERAAGVEAEPAEPEERGAEDGHRRVVWLAGLEPPSGQDSP